MTSITQNPLPELGYATALPTTENVNTGFGYAFGAFAAPESWTRIIDVKVQDSSVCVVNQSGEVLNVPFDASLVGFERYKSEEGEANFFEWLDNF